MAAWKQEEKASTHIWCLKLKTSDLWRRESRAAELRWPKKWRSSSAMWLVFRHFCSLLIISGLMKNSEGLWLLSTSWRWSENENYIGEAGISLLPAARGTWQQLPRASLPQTEPVGGTVISPQAPLCRKSSLPFPLPHLSLKDTVGCENDEDNKMCCSIILYRSWYNSSPQAQSAQPPVSHRLTQRALHLLWRRLENQGDGGASFYLI